MCRFTFRELCGQPLSAADYLEIVRHYDTMVLEDVPRMTLEHRNEARRFITLVDMLYDGGVHRTGCLVERVMLTAYDYDALHSTR